MTHPLALAQAFLFVPANRPDRFAKSLATRADAVIVDLEDAVPLSEKAAARDAIRRDLTPWLEQCPQRLVLRINACGTPFWDDDLRLVEELGIRHLMLPKTESVEQLSSVTSALSFTPVLIPMIESAKGVDQLKAIAAHPNTLRLSLGNIDLQLSLGLQCGPDELELLPVRHQILLASRLAEIAAPIDGVTVQIESQAQLSADILRAKRLGFRAKLCIHPKQVDGVIEGFQPSAQEVEYAQAVVAADKAANGGVVQLNGKMVDRPVVMLAQSVLAQAHMYPCTP
jgi:citrate lyase subunit beta/citryl-CoA lyase